jgi:hypothetical protein
MKIVNYKICLLVIFLPIVVFGQKKCSDVLQVAFNTTQINESEDATNSVFNFLKSDKLKEYMSKQSGGFSLGFDGFNIGVNSSDGEYSNLRDYLNSQNSYDSKKKIVRSVLLQIPNTEAYKVWLACINGQGFFYDYEAVGDGYKLFIGYHPTAGVSDVSLEQLKISNATYDEDLIQKGDKIWNDPIEMVVHPKDKTMDITISIRVMASTSLIVKSYTIPGIKPAVKDSQTLKSKCLDSRDVNACYEYVVELKQKFTQKVNNSNNPDLQLTFSKLIRTYENYAISIKNNVPKEEFFKNPFKTNVSDDPEYEFKNLLASLNISY